jgi:hypothetical protein
MMKRTRRVLLQRVLMKAWWLRLSKPTTLRDQEVCLKLRLAKHRDESRSLGIENISATLLDLRQANKFIFQSNIEADFCF